MTYGQVATYLGSPRAARAVGYALMSLPDPAVPWHRVVNAQGGISVGGRVDRPVLQARRLRREGVRLGEDERIDLSRFRHVPPLALALDAVPAAALGKRAPAPRRPPDRSGR